jgi:hypothetical protein
MTDRRAFIGERSHDMNVQLINPAAVRRLFDDNGTGPRTDAHGAGRGWIERLWGRVGEAIRFRRALHQLRRLDRRDLDDLDLAPADFPALARRHARGLEPLARPC